jgi:hypothetical protein
VPAALKRSRTYATHERDLLREGDKNEKK